MYNRYIPEDMSYEQIQEPVSSPPPQSRPVSGRRPAQRPLPLPDFLTKGEGLSGLLKGLRLDKLDSGDILLLLIALYLLVEGDDPELAIALGVTVFLGLGE